MTLDDLDRVLPSRNREKPLDPNQVTPRSRDALEVYDELQAIKLNAEEDIFDDT